MNSEIYYIDLTSIRKLRANCVQPKNKKAPNFLEALYLLAVWTGLEPATPCVTGRYSNQLNYQTVAFSDCKYTSVIELHKQLFVK